MSPPPRLYHPVAGSGQPLGSVTEVELSEAQQHHLIHVLRLQAGARFEIFDGQGRIYPAHLDGTRAVLGAPVTTPLPTQVTLLQALPKADKLEWILQKGTELGASGFVVFPSARSVAKLPADRLETKSERWRKIVEEAARQCRRADLPQLRLHSSLASTLDALGPASDRELWMLDEDEKTVRLGQAYDERRPGASLFLAIGPEGGWDRSEVEAARRAGARAVTLGARVLRTETAGIAALSATLHRAGDLG